MKKTLLTALLTLGVAGSSFAAGSNGDLILGFRDDGSDGGIGTTTNITFDLGNVGLYETHPGVTVDTGFNVGTTLASTYGAGYQTDTGLLWGVVGASGNTGTTRDLWVSAAATGSQLNGTNLQSDGSTLTSTPWTIQSTFSQSSQASKFLTLYANQATNPFSVGTAVSTSWSTLESSTSSAFGGFTKSLFEASSANGNVADLYELNPQSNGPGVGSAGVFLGSFSITSGGELDFTGAGSAIPEPSTYAAILGAAVLAVALIRRRQNSLAL
jgi:hypothetical protein